MLLGNIEPYLQVINIPIVSQYAYIVGNYSPAANSLQSAHSRYCNW